MHVKFANFSTRHDSAAISARSTFHHIACYVGVRPVRQITLGLLHVPVTIGSEGKVMYCYKLLEHTANGCTYTEQTRQRCRRRLEIERVLFNDMLPEQESQKRIKHDQTNNNNINLIT